MARRILCLLLALCLMLPLAPRAWAGYLTGPSYDPEPVVVPVWQDGSMKLNAYRYNKDLLFSAEDLARLTRFDLSLTQDYITFTRGMKRVNIHIRDSLVLAMNNEQGLKLHSPVLLLDGKYYLSASTMLSWLNVNCYAEDRELHILPAPISFWDLIGEYEPARFDFSMAECSRLMLRSEKELESLAYMEKSFSGRIMDKISGGGWTEKQYFNLFEDMMLDQSAADAARDTLEACANGLGWAFSAAETITETIKKDKMSTILQHIGLGVDAAADLCAYALLFVQDNDTKIAMLDALAASYDDDEYSHLITAARQVSQAYSNAWLGVMYKLGYDFVYEFAADYSCLTLLDWLGADYIKGVAQGELMKRFAAYEQLSDMANALYVNKIGNYSDVFGVESLAMLYLYGVEQRYRAMAKHVLDNDYIDDFIADSISAYADRAQEQYAKFLAASAYADLDSIDDDFRSEEADAILLLFEDLKVTEPLSSNAIALERGIFLSFLRESGMTDARWGLTDLDGDKTEELLVLGRVDRAGSRGCMVLDGETLSVCNFEGSDGYAMLQRDSVSGRIYLLYSYNMYDEYRSEYYVWQDSGWTKAATAYFDPIYENHESTTLEYEKTFTVNGTAATEGEYNAFVGKLKLTDLPDSLLTSPDLQDVTISGKADTLSTGLYHILEHHPGYLRSTQDDLNGDGRDDRAFLLYNALEARTRTAQKLFCTGSEYLLSDTTRRATLLSVTDQGSSVRVRFMNTNLPLEYVKEGPAFHITDGYLQMVDQYFVYREGQGEPFTRDLAGTALGDLLYGRDAAEMDRNISDENIWPYGSPYGGAYHDCEGYPTELVYGKIYRGDAVDIGVVDARFREYYPTVYDFLPKILPGMTSADFLIYVNTEAGTTNPVDFKDPTTGEVMAQSKTFWYIQDTNWYYLVTTYLSKTNGTVLFADAELMKRAPINFFEEYYGTIPSELAEASARDRNLMEYCLMSYPELSQISWSESYTYRAGFTDNVWFYDCFLNGAHMSFSFLGDLEGNSDPISIHITDCDAGIRITDTLITGKTFDQLSKDNDFSELSWMEGYYVAYGYADGFALELIFIGDTETSAVLTEVYLTGM